jgi:PD-(D/E)XK nuclease superfamily
MRPPTLAPLSQSRQGDMACETLYVFKHVRREKIAESEPAARGIEIHRILATYIDRLVKVGRAVDLEVFDQLMRSTSGEAREVLERFRDNHAFDAEKVLATELYIALDEAFEPVEDSGSSDGGPSTKTARIPAYEGTLDLVMLHSLTVAEVEDWKSYYQIIAADTFQSKFYPMLLMSLNPSLERVKFNLELVRYGISRCVEYTRADLPRLRELAQSERARQRELHKRNDSRKAPASPGRHCTWCPLLLNGCPVAKTNPYRRMTPERRLRFALWLQQAERHNTIVLKDLVTERGPIRYRDENQNEYVAAFEAVEKKSYPYNKVSSVLAEWVKGHPEDRELMEGLSASGLSSRVKAKKRGALFKELQALAIVRVDTELKIGRAETRETEIPADPM